MTAARSTLLVSLLALSSSFFPESLAQEGKDAGEVVIAEGVGKDEAAARKAAFRAAVGRVVGVLVDAETLVKNDKVIEERILEFSGGFIKTFDVLKVEKTEGDLVRVRIKATVERLRIAERLVDAKVTTKELKGSDLLAEKLTKEEARKNAKELLAKLFAELPKVVTCEVVGKPVLTADQKEMKLQLVVRADLKAYAEFRTKAVALLDKIATVKDTMLLNAVLGQNQTYGKDISNNGFVRDPSVQGEIPRGYRISLLTDIDGTGTRTAWACYWVDAPVGETVFGSLLSPRAPQAGALSSDDMVITLKFLDKAGEVISQDEVALAKKRTFEWFLFSIDRQSTEGRSYPTLVLAPVEGIGIPSSYRGAIGFEHRFAITDKELERVTEIKVAVVNRVGK
jgi:hypothetical protein